MNTVKRLVPAFAAALVLLSIISGTTFSQAPAGSWWGNVTLVKSGTANTTTAGVPVEVLINNISKQNTTVGKHTPGYYIVDINGNAGDNVTFRVYGIDASPTNSTPQSYTSGDHGQLDLLVHLFANGASCPLSYLDKPSSGNIHNGCAGGYCIHDICRTASTYCGDGYCDSGENCASDNSACATGYACTDGCVATGGSGTSTSGGGGGGGGAPPEDDEEEEDEETSSEQEPEETQTVAGIGSGSSDEIPFTNTEIGVTEITIIAREPITQNTITIKKPSSKPSEVTQPSGKLYAYLVITTGIADEAVETTTITFTVTQSWISSNNIDPGSVVMQRYNVGWGSLQTDKVSETTEKITYKATAPGFSVFAVTGSEKQTLPTTTCEPGAKTCLDDQKLGICRGDGTGYEEIECPLGCSNGECNQIATEPLLDQSTLIGITIAIAIAAIMVVLVHSFRRKPRKRKLKYSFQ